MHDTAWDRTTEGGDAADGADPWSEFLGRLLVTTSLAGPAAGSLAEDQEPFAAAGPDGKATSDAMVGGTRSDGKLPDC